MAFLLELNEGTANRRRVPFRLFDSTGTAPFTSGSNITMLGSLNGAAQLSLGSVSVVSANAGQYYFEFSQSNLSVLGSWALYTDNVANYPQHVATAQVVNNNPMSTLSAISDVTLAAKEYSNVTMRIGLVNYSGATVGAGNFAPGVYSGVSFSVRDSGIATTSFQAGNYSGVSVEVKSGGIQTSSVGAGNYSGMSVEIKTGGIQTTSFGAGTYSSVTFQGVTRINSSVTLNADTHSGATIQGILDPTAIWNASRSSYSAFGGFGAASQVVSLLTLQGGTVSTLTLNSAETTKDSFFNGCLLMIQYADGSRAGAIISSYSGSQKSALLLNTLAVAPVSGNTYVIYPGADAGIGLSVWSSYLTRSITSIAAGSFSGVTIDGVKFLSTAGERSAASSLLSTSLGGTTPRLIQQSFELLRNKVTISGSTMTVFKSDDATSSWTATISTGTATVYGVTPGLA